MSVDVINIIDISGLSDTPRNHVMLALGLAVNLHVMSNVSLTKMVVSWGCSNIDGIAVKWQLVILNLYY